MKYSEILNHREGNAMDVAGQLNPNTDYIAVLRNVEEREIDFGTPEAPDVRPVAMADIWASLDGDTYFPASVGARPFLRGLNLGSAQDQITAMKNHTRYNVRYTQSGSGAQRRKTYVGSVYTESTSAAESASTQE